MHDNRVWVAGEGKPGVAGWRVPARPRPLGTPWPRAPRTDGRRATPAWAAVLSGENSSRRLTRAVSRSARTGRAAGFQVSHRHLMAERTTPGDPHRLHERRSAGSEQRSARQGGRLSCRGPDAPPARRPQRRSRGPASRSLSGSDGPGGVVGRLVSVRAGDGRPGSGGSGQPPEPRRAGITLSPALVSSGGSSSDAYWPCEAIFELLAVQRRRRRLPRVRRCRAVTNASHRSHFA